MKNNNTLAAYHIIGIENGALKLDTRKLFHWHIPKVLREDPIHRGDIVTVRANRGKTTVKTPALVMDVFREDIEDTGIKHQMVTRVIEKAPQ